MKKDDHMTILRWAQKLSVSTQFMQSKLFGGPKNRYKICTPRIAHSHIAQNLVCVSVCVLTASHAQCTSIEFEQVYATRLKSHGVADGNVVRCSYTIGNHPNLIFWIGTTISFRFDGIRLFLLTIATSSPIATEALRNVGRTVHQCKHHENSQQIRTLLLMIIFIISLRPTVYAENVATGIASVPINIIWRRRPRRKILFAITRLNSLIAFKFLFIYTKHNNKYHTFFEDFRNKQKHTQSLEVCWVASAEIRASQIFFLFEYRMWCDQYYALRGNLVILIQTMLLIKHRLSATEHWKSLFQKW